MAKKKVVKDEHKIAAESFINNMLNNAEIYKFKSYEQDDIMKVIETLKEVHGIEDSE